MSIEEVTEQPSVVTSCRECIFAKWDNKTQIGCQFDRLDKFEENGAEIVGQDDGEKQYFLILGRFCNACRNREWGKQYPKRKWKTLVTERIKVQIDIVIHVWGNHGLIDIMNTVDLAYRQNPRPKSVVIVCDPDYTNVPVVDIVSKMKNETRGPWRIEQQYLENVLKHCKGQYYAIFNAGYNIPLYFTETINCALNQNMTRFVALLADDDGNGLVVQQCGLSYKKISSLADDTQTGHMIKTFEDL